MSSLFNIGIDIGSTATKVVVLDDTKTQILHQMLMPTGWSGREAADRIYSQLAVWGIVPEQASIVATGYGRVSVPFAHKTLTEITCHGKGAAFLFEKDGIVVDIGGQDTKIITLTDGAITNFLMNDKCSAGTGRFLEIMATTLGVDLEELLSLAAQGSEVSISSMCTVFAESEVIGMIGSGRAKADIAFGIVDSIVQKVSSLCERHASRSGNLFFLTGGLCEAPYLLQQLSQRLQAPVTSHPLARYAGALGAALLAQ